MVGECLDDLVRQFPSLEKVLFYERRDLNDYIGVCINRELLTVWEEPLTKSVLDGEELSIILVGIAGG